MMSPVKAAQYSHGDLSSLGFLLKCAHSLMSNVVEPALMDLGFTYVQYVVLLRLRGSALITLIAKHGARSLRRLNFVPRSIGLRVRIDDVPQPIRPIMARGPGPNSACLPGHGINRGRNTV
jgi:hypothetical protein